MGDGRQPAVAPGMAMNLGQCPNDRQISRARELYMSFIVRLQILDEMNR